MPRLTLNAVNAELARRGHKALLAKAGGYFYFWSGEAADWLDRTVNVAKVPHAGAVGSRIRTAEKAESADHGQAGRRACGGAIRKAGITMTMESDSEAWARVWREMSDANLEDALKRSVHVACCALAQRPREQSSSVNGVRRPGSFRPSSLRKKSL